MRTWFATPPKLGGSMKRLSIIMLALLFVAGTLVAMDISVTGKASAEFELDFLDEDAQINRADSVAIKYQIIFGEASGEKIGSGALRAEIMGSASLRSESPKAGADPAAPGARELTLAGKVDTAKIYLNDIWVDLLKGPGGYDYAKSPFGGDALGDDIETDFEGVGDGLLFGFGDFTVGADIYADWSGADTDFFFSTVVETPELYLSPELSAKFAAGVKRDAANDFYLGASAKLDYEMDGMGFGLAADVDDLKNIDVLLTTTVDPFKVQLYYAMYDASVDVFEAKATAPIPAGGMDSLLVILDNQMEVTPFTNKFQATLDAKIDANLSGKVWGGFRMDNGFDSWNAGVSAKAVVDAWTFEGDVELKHDGTDLEIPFGVKVSSANVLIDAATVFAEYRRDLSDADAAKHKHFAKIGANLSF